MDATSIYTPYVTEDNVKKTKQNKTKYQMTEAFLHGTVHFVNTVLVFLLALCRYFRYCIHIKQ